MFWMRNKENNFPIRTLIWRPAVWTQIILVLMEQFDLDPYCSHVKFGQCMLLKFCLFDLNLYDPVMFSSHIFSLSDVVFIMQINVKIRVPTEIQKQNSMIFP